MKKHYKKPNICAIDFDILDIIYTSAGENAGATNPDDDWEFDMFMAKGPKSNGGFDGIGWY